MDAAWRSPKPQQLAPVLEMIRAVKALGLETCPAGREQMTEAVQALCFFAGANSIFYGEKLLTTGNPQAEADRALLDKLGMQVTEPFSNMAEAIS